MPKIEAILFDLGDTLVHFETSRAREFLEAGTLPVYQRLSEWGFAPPPYAKYLRALKRSFALAVIWSRVVRWEVDLQGAFRRMNRRWGIDLTDAQVTELGLLCVPPIRPFFTIDKRAHEVIPALSRAGFKLGLVSNTLFPGFAIDDVLRGEGLLEEFPVRVYSSEVRYMKPHRRIFELALERLRAPAERTLFVGDRLDKDVRGSARAGMRTMWFARAGQRRRGRVTPDFIIRDLSEIPVLLKSQCGAEAFPARRELAPVAALSR